MYILDCFHKMAQPGLSKKLKLGARQPSAIVLLCVLCIVCTCIVCASPSHPLSVQAHCLSISHCEQGDHAATPDAIATYGWPHERQRGGGRCHATETLVARTRDAMRCTIGIFLVSRGSVIFPIALLLFLNGIISYSLAQTVLGFAGQLQTTTSDCHTACTHPEGRSPSHV